MDQKLIEVAKSMGIDKDTLVQKIKEKYSEFIEEGRFNDLRALQETIDSLEIKVEPPRDIILEEYRDYFDQIMDFQAPLPLWEREYYQEKAASELKELYSITKVPIPDDLIQEIQKRYEYCINNEQYTHLEKLMHLVGDIVPLPEDMVQKKYKELLRKSEYNDTRIESQKEIGELRKITKIEPEDNILEEYFKKHLYHPSYWEGLVQVLNPQQLERVITKVYKKLYEDSIQYTNDTKPFKRVCPFFFKIIYEKTGIKPQFSEDEIKKLYKRLLWKWYTEEIEEVRDVIGFIPKFSENLVQKVYTNEIFEELFSDLPDEADTIVNGIKRIYQLTKVKPKLSEGVVQQLYDALIKNRPELIPILYKLTGIAPKSEEAYKEVISYIMKEED